VTDVIEGNGGDTGGAPIENAEPVVESRPEWLPEKFWVEGKPAYDKLAQSYGELEKMRGTLREKLVEELSAERLAARPEAPNAYKLPEHEKLDQEQLEASGVVQWWRQFAHEQGYNQEQFETAISTYAELQVKEIEEGYQREFQKLGESATARIEAVQLWAGNYFNEEEQSAISAACTTAAGVAAMEKVMSALKGSGIVDNSVFEKKPEVTRADVEKMMQDRRYWHPADRDPAFVRQVEEFFSKSYR
jgi:hypothetical protein